MRFFYRRNIASETSITRSVVPSLNGSMTAHQAWTMVDPVTRALDLQARLTFIASGLDMSSDGRSRTWEFIFFLAGRNAVTMLSLEPEAGTADVDTARIILTQRLKPASAINAGRPAFPGRFRDSPEVVAEFSAGGVDFAAGPTDMKLEGRVLPSGDAVWVTLYWDGEHTTAFGTAGA